MSSDKPPFTVAILIYPNMTLIDFAGPQNVLGFTGRTHVVWKSLEPVVTDTGVSINPDTTFETCPRDVDVLFVPGAVDNVRFMQDEDVLAFLRELGASARYVTSVCTGSLLLGAAGLLDGYKAASHWAFLDVLRDLGVDASTARVTRDRNRFSGGGATAGIDFGLTLLTELQGEQVAKMVQLGIQYSPEPPFRSGHPDEASPEVLGMANGLLDPVVAEGHRIALEVRQERTSATD